MGKMMPRMLMITSRTSTPERQWQGEPERYREPMRREPERYREPERMPERDMRGQGWITWDRMEPPIYPMGSNVTDMREYKRETGKDDAQGKIGFAREREWNGDDADCMDKETAERWVRSMVAADGTRGGKWRSMQDVRALAQQHDMGSDEELPAFWAALNATYSDIAKVAKKYNVDRPDFYADIADALYFTDADAVEDKLEKYYRYLVKKD